MWHGAPPWHTVPADPSSSEPWRSVERRLQQQLWSILPVRSAWSKGFPLSERRRAAQKVGAVSILWKNNPEVARGRLGCVGDVVPALLDPRCLHGLGGYRARGR